jgi:8-oxo-dGTP diphosphatase
MNIRGKYPNTFYRVSLKAVIRNDQGEVLVVKENGSNWSLPGGGIDHGEDDMTALKRELLEEVAYEGEFEATPRATASFFLESRDAWLLWVVYDVKTVHQTFGVGVDADEVQFIDPCLFKNATSRSEQLVYKMCVDPNAPVTLP